MNVLRVWTGILDVSLHVHVRTVFRRSRSQEGAGVSSRFGLGSTEARTHAVLGAAAGWSGARVRTESVSGRRRADAARQQTTTHGNTGMRLQCEYCVENISCIRVNVQVKVWFQNRRTKKKRENLQAQNQSAATTSTPMTSSTLPSVTSLVLPTTRANPTPDSLRWDARSLAGAQVDSFSTLSHNAPSSQCFRGGHHWPSSDATLPTQFTFPTSFNFMPK